MARPDIGRLARAGGEDGARFETSRPVYFPDQPDAVAAAVFDRSALAPGFTGAGPAIIEEYGSTTPIGPGDEFTMGELGEIRISRGAGK